MGSTVDRSRRRSLLAAGFVALGAGALTLIHWLGSADGTPNRLIASTAFGSAFVSVAVAVVISELTDAPEVTAGAGLGLIAMSLGSFSPVVLPFVIPAAIFTQRGFTHAEFRASKFPISAAVAALAFAAMFALIVHQDPARWQSSGVSYGSSNVVTAPEAIISLALSALVVFAAVAAGLANHRVSRSTDSVTRDLVR